MLSLRGFPRITGCNRARPMSNMVRLSDLQRRVVDHGAGPLLVVAGPGSGKTRVLTQRVHRLLQQEGGNFRILALTFTNKAAKEMEERLSDLGELRRRAHIQTLHSFCLEMLADRGERVGVNGYPAIFERAADRKAILREAVLSDPLLTSELENAGDARAQNACLDRWQRAIAARKARPLSGSPQDDLGKQIVDAYDRTMQANGALDYDDLLLLAHRLLSDVPSVAAFYRRLFAYICVDEAQDMNEAQYAVLLALCGTEHRNVLMVGDPRQSIFGFNNSSSGWMETFQSDFGATRIELIENFRSSAAVVQAARQLQPGYQADVVLPIPGAVDLIAGETEDEEAELVVGRLENLFADGHPDVEGSVTAGRCAVLARTRYALLAVEKRLEARGHPYYRSVSGGIEVASEVAGDLVLAMRIACNTSNALHYGELGKRWGLAMPMAGKNSGLTSVLRLVEAAPSERARCVGQASDLLTRDPTRPNFLTATEELVRYAQRLPEEEARLIREDVIVLRDEWDRYIRSSRTGSRSISAFLAAMALGSTRQAPDGAVGLLTVHSAKGLEWDVVFIVGMAEGIFPDYRAADNPRAEAEEVRNAFVAITRARRIVVLSYPATRVMPWGGVRIGYPSRFLRKIGLVDPS